MRVDGEVVKGYRDELCGWVQCVSLEVRVRRGQRVSRSLARPVWPGGDRCNLGTLGGRE